VLEAGPLSPWLDSDDMLMRDARRAMRGYDKAWGTKPSSISGMDTRVSGEDRLNWSDATEEKEAVERRKGSMSTSKLRTRVERARSSCSRSTEDPRRKELVLVGEPSSMPDDEDDSSEKRTLEERRRRGRVCEVERCLYWEQKSFARAEAKREMGGGSEVYESSDDDEGDAVKDESVWRRRIEVGGGATRCVLDTVEMSYRSVSNSSTWRWVTHRGRAQPPT